MDFDSSFAGLLAQAGDGGGGAGGGWQLLTIFLPIMVLYYFMFTRHDRRRQSAQRAMLGNLKKNDRVVTIGGIYGVVMNVQKDADEVTLKVDEATNTKLRVKVSSIAEVLATEPPADTATKT